MPRFERQLRLPMLLLLSVLAVRADVTLPMVLAEHMVLQCGLPLHIWGAADAGESVSVEFRGALQPRDGSEVLSRGVLLRPGHPAETGCAAGTDRIGLGRHARRGVDQSSRAIRGRRLDAGVFRVEPYERWPGQGAAPASKAGARMGARRRPGEVGGSHASGPSVAAQRRQFVDAGGFV